MQVEDNLALISRGRGNYVDLARLQCPSKPARCPDRYGGFSCAQDYYKWTNVQLAKNKELWQARGTRESSRFSLTCSCSPPSWSATPGWRPVSAPGSPTSSCCCFRDCLQVLVRSRLETIQQPAVQRQLGVDTGNTEPS